MKAPLVGGVNYSTDLHLFSRNQRHWPRGGQGLISQVQINLEAVTLIRLNCATIWRSTRTQTTRALASPYLEPGRHALLEALRGLGVGRSHVLVLLLQVGPVLHHARHLLAVNLLQALLGLLKRRESVMRCCFGSPTVLCCALACLFTL